jgi:hypothetical protein
VVEFLVDNTLGRIWYEMQNGDTTLKDICRFLVRRPTEVLLKEGEQAPAASTGGENLRQEELLKQPVYIPHRPKRDPRDLRILDPACGSGHFLLYAFDLLETIYEEGWGDEQSAECEATGKSLREEYADLESLKRALPELILRHNLHGIDIDLRACQIAALAVWLRAQRAYQRLGLKLADRPKITKSNIVCAEPMPGERQLLDQFVADIRPKVLGQLVRVVFEKMKLAGEAGPLLKVEEEIASAVADAKKKWLAGPRQEQTVLFGDLRPQQTDLSLDFSGITDATFWKRAEERIYAELRTYSERAENGHVYQRRLFAEDAARGFAFIDICRKRYDVVLMNPPFGEWTLSTKPLALSCYPITKYDIYAAFVERGTDLLDKDAFLGAITSRTGFFLSSFQRWREEVLLRKAPPSVYADLGHGVLDSAMVEVAAYCLTTRVRRTIFLRALEYGDKGSAIWQLIHGGDRENQNRYEITPASFSAIPRSPFAYWTSPRLRALFQGRDRVETDGRLVRIGLTTHEDFRWLRLSWECTDDAGPVPFAKGGKYSKFYADIHLCVLWGNNGTLLKTSKLERLRMGELTANNSQCWNEPLYFRPGITWPRRTERLSFRVMPRGCIFADKGPAIFLENDGRQSLLALLALVNSKPFSALVALQLARTELARSYEVGLIQQTPCPKLSSSDETLLAGLSMRAWSVSHAVDQNDSTSHAFIAPGLLLVEGATLAQKAEAWNGRLSTLHAAIAAAQKEIDEVSLRLYALEETDVAHPGDAGGSAAEVADDDEEQNEPDANSSNVSYLVSDLLGYALGCAFGRWDIRCATREKAAPELTDPFAPLPFCAPGALQTEQVLPLTEHDARRLCTARAWDYPLGVPWDGILVDDPNHANDVVRRVREILAVIWKDRAEAIEHEACQILGVRDLGEYFRKPALFFADHLKRHSKSRRQAPIYWPLSTASGSYTLWVYYQHLNEDLLYTALNKHVKPKIDSTEKELRRIESELLNAKGREASALRTSFEGATSLLEELQEFRDELARVAALPYKPNLNDGVLISASPLWKLFRLPKWRKDLEECWKSLATGAFDWAHIAYYIWPDRVREVCRHDRSIAITHGLEEVCEVTAKAANKKQLRKEKIQETLLGEER